MKRFIEWLRWVFLKRSRHYGFDLGTDDGRKGTFTILDAGQFPAGDLKR